MHGSAIPRDYNAAHDLIQRTLAVWQGVLGMSVVVVRVSVTKTPRVSA